MPITPTDRGKLTTGRKLWVLMHSAAWSERKRGRVEGTTGSSHSLWEKTFETYFMSRNSKGSFLHRPRMRFKRQQSMQNRVLRLQQGPAKLPLTHFATLHSNRNDERFHLDLCEDELRSGSTRPVSLAYSQQPREVVYALTEARLAAAAAAPLRIRVSHGRHKRPARKNKNKKK